MSGMLTLPWSPTTLKAGRGPWSHGGQRVCCYCPGTIADPPSVFLLIASGPEGRPVEVISRIQLLLSACWVGLMESSDKRMERRRPEYLFQSSAWTTAFLSLFHSLSCPPGLGMITFPVLISHNKVLSLISLYAHPYRFMNTLFIKLSINQMTLVSCG